jgi:hypothetical protein
MFAASESSHGPLTARVDGPSSFWGGAGHSPPPEGALVGQASKGYCRCIGFWGTPIHLLLGHFNGPSSLIRSRKKILPQQRRPS